MQGLPIEIQEAFGQEMEDTFTMLVYGDSSQGKTNLIATLLKALGHLGRMLYVSWEEGTGSTVRRLILEHKLHELYPNMQFSEGETIEELMEFLAKKNSPKIVVLDTWQYSGFTYRNYQMLKEAFVFGRTNNRRKIIIIISHISGKQPDGKSAIQVRRDAHIKVWVEKFVAFVTTRFRGTKNYCIWEKGAQEYWGANLPRVLNKENINDKPAKTKAKKPPPKRPAKAKSPPPEAAPEAVTQLSFLPEAEKPIFKEP